MPKRLYMLRRPPPLDDEGDEHIKALRDQILKFKAPLAEITKEKRDLLQRWLDANQHTVDVWPANVLAARINDILEGQIPPIVERLDLFHTIAILSEATSDTPALDNSLAPILTKPAPPVVFPNHNFCLTGRFVMGPRVNIDYEITERGGTFQTAVNSKTNYVIIGAVDTRDRFYSPRNPTIQSALRLIGRGHPLALVSEEHWANHLL
ncbi:MAG: hypothetical protein H8K03_19890 [Nitrospira sp.]